MYQVICIYFILCIDFRLTFIFLFLDVGSSARVAFLCPNDVTYLMTQWASWMAGHICVPLFPKHPTNLLEYYVKDSGAEILITTKAYESILGPVAISLNRRLIVIDHKELIPTPETIADSLLTAEANQLVLDDAFYNSSSALILYTSGTTGQPKGVVLSHKAIDSQLKSLSNAWQMAQTDIMLHVLPLNHTHGCINGLLLPLFNGAKIIMLPQYNTSDVWSHLLHINQKSKDCVNLFMAVPTIYNFLIEEFNRVFSKNIRLCEYIKTHCSHKIRLMVSGSAPLPLNVFDTWQKLTGHRLLERYGMTETGMSLSNTYQQNELKKRVPGTVGQPLPSVEAKIVDPVTLTTLHLARGEFDKGVWSKDTPVFRNNIKNESVNGELCIRGPTIFSHYWERPDETRKEFTEDGWFRTGDTVAFENGSFKILGRTSVDIIKTGGHKVSALEIENQLLEHPDITDIAVVGIPDVTWGHKIAAVIVSNRVEGETPLELNELKKWAEDHMANYTIPTVVKFVDAIPRNTMGKVNKKSLLTEMFTENL